MGRRLWALGMPFIDDPTAYGDLPDDPYDIELIYTAFARLLPGSGLSIFGCEGCIEAGEWSDAMQLIWLPRQSPIELLSNGPASVLRAARQWIADDHPCIWDLPKPLAEKVRQLPSHLPWSQLPEQYQGTKAGGLPHYLQGDETLFDAEGCLMEYIGQFVTPEPVSFHGYGYLFHSTTTGETVAVLQDT